MSFGHPLVLIPAVLFTAAAVAGYVLLQRRRTAALAAVGFGRLAGGGIRRHLPYVLLLAALPILLTGLARPSAELSVPHVSGTVILAFDVSNSMKATDVTPSRLGAAQTAAKQFVEGQPDSVDIGVLLFGDQALLTQAPTDDRPATQAAIDRATTSGGTSLGQAILVGLGAVTGKPVSLPTGGDADPDTAAPANELGYWPSATIVIFSDGQETGGPDVTQAAELAAGAGVRVQTVGVGTAKGATVEVDGYQLGTALDESLLTMVAQTTGGTYQQAGNTQALVDTTRSIDLRLTTRTEPIELTAPFAAAALLLLAIGSLLNTRWHGRIV
ncbi:VWA domain-containing protein [Micromonospora sp. NBC_01796]|uniref:VWA domain-containing protein n=1 Tax=Micromonospora sp. NBC_01796 TaxID=2975987 RepID=UPI002DDBD532|nr:VWA domain-containing protein [Micromonospora sp. NBC_01796]WSA84018.1 VWA domain-containing protein [Micromonospora sp. NBC_01796]